MVVVSVFFLSRLIHLDSLPVFADEAIYIRWAQLMRQDFGRYAMFPIQDGKTPLHMIVLSQILPWYHDPLMVSRVMSVGFGLINLGVLVWLVKTLDGGRLAQMCSLVLYLLLPFTLFHDRMGLIDTMLLTGLGMTFLGFLKVFYTHSWLWVIVTGLAYGAALWIKLPALFFIPVILVLFILLSGGENKKSSINIIQFGVAGLLGVGIFLMLRWSQVFPALFTRGNDFTFSITDILSGQLSHIRRNFFFITSSLTTYTSYALFALIAVQAYFESKKTKGTFFDRYTVISLFLLGVIFLLPFLLLGRVIASRYFLPVVIFLIPAAALAIESLWQSGKKKVVVVLASLMLFQLLYFDAKLLFDVENTPFTADDTIQYLTEWSAGFGNKEVRDFIRKEAVDTKVRVVTEGYFGTLPDGLLMYFDGSKEISEGRLEIRGIGQPVRDIPKEVLNEAEVIDTYLMVNEHRLQLNSPACCSLVAAYLRPHGGPALLLLKVNNDE